MRRDWVVTSKHVIWDEENLSFREPIYLISTDPKIQEKRIEPKNYFFHPHIDLAIVETKNDMCKLPFFPAHQAFNDNHNVAAIGYSRSNSAFDKINFRAVPLKHVRTESRERECGPEESYEFEFEGSEPGNSGGPVFGDGAARNDEATCAATYASTWAAMASWRPTASAAAAAARPDAASTPQSTPASDAVAAAAALDVAVAAAAATARRAHRRWAARLPSRTSAAWPPTPKRRTERRVAA